MRTMFSGNNNVFLYGVPEASRRKCLRGAVRGFARAMLQVGDPYLSAVYTGVVMRER